MRRDLRARALLVFASAYFATALTGCPPAERKSPPKATCARFGDTCEYSPGKLGTCVARDDCATAPCYVCQSQH